VTAALLALLLSLSPAWSEEPAPRELIYGSQLLTHEERQQYRRDMREARDPQAQNRVRNRNRERTRERARQRGVDLRDPEGVVRQ
jgi:hypothetical protein